MCCKIRSTNFSHTSQKFKRYNSSFLTSRSSGFHQFFFVFFRKQIYFPITAKKIKIPFNAFLLSSPTFLCIIKYFALIFCLEKSHLKMPTLPPQKSLIFCWPWHEFWNIFCLCCVSHQIFSFSKISIMVVKTTL